MRVAVLQGQGGKGSERKRGKVGVGGQARVKGSAAVALPAHAAGSRHYAMSRLGLVPHALLNPPRVSFCQERHTKFRKGSKLIHCWRPGPSARSPPRPNLLCPLPSLPRAPPASAYHPSLLKVPLPSALISPSPPAERQPLPQSQLLPQPPALPQPIPQPQPQPLLQLSPHFQPLSCACHLQFLNPAPSDSSAELGTAPSTPRSMMPVAVPTSFMPRHAVPVAVTRPTLTPLLQPMQPCMQQPMQPQPIPVQPRAAPQQRLPDSTIGVAGGAFMPESAITVPAPSTD